MSEWHTHQAELNRKVTEQLVEYVNKFEVEKSITASEFRHVCDALYHTTTGLIDWEISNMIALVQKEIK